MTPSGAGSGSRTTFSSAPTARSCCRRLRWSSGCSDRRGALSSYIRRIFSRLPQVCIEHQRRRPLMSRNTQPQSRPGSGAGGRCGRGRRAGRRRRRRPRSARGAARRATIRARSRRPPGGPASRGDGLRVGEPQAGEGELVRLLVPREGREDGCSAERSPRESSSSSGPPGRPAMPIRSPQRSSESGSSSTSWPRLASSSVQSVELAKSSDSEPPCSLIVSGVGVTT